MDGDVVVGRVVDPGSAAPVIFSDAVRADAVGAPGAAGSPSDAIGEGVSSVAVAGPAGEGAVSVAGRFRSWLASVDSAGLTDRERVELVAELERVKGAASAAQARATDAVACSQRVVAPQDVARSVGAQVALARRESPSLGDRFVGLARALVHEMPHTMAALTAGECSERVAVAVVAATATLSVAGPGCGGCPGGSVAGPARGQGRRWGGGAGGGGAGRGVGGAADGGGGQESVG